MRFGAIFRRWPGATPTPSFAGIYRGHTYSFAWFGPVMVSWWKR